MIHHHGDHTPHTLRVHHKEKQPNDQHLTSLLHEKDRLLLCHNQLVNEINKECAHKVDQLLQCKQQSINELQNNLVSSLTAINHDIMAVLLVMTGKNVYVNGISSIGDSLSAYSNSYSPTIANQNNSNISHHPLTKHPPINNAMYFANDDNDSKMMDVKEWPKKNTIFVPDFSSFPVMHISTIPTKNPTLTPTSIPTSVPTLISNPSANAANTDNDTNLTFPILTSAAIPTSFPAFNSSAIPAIPAIELSSLSLSPTLDSNHTSSVIAKERADEKIADTKKEKMEKLELLPGLVVKEELHVNIRNTNNMLIVDSVQCNLCHRSFDSSKNLAKHLSIDHLFSCDLCHKSFARKVDLNRHMRLHSTDPNEIVYECQICYKTYRSTGALHNHLRVHNMNKSANMHLAQTFSLVLPETHRLFECSECGKGFTQVHHLKRHLRIHTGEQPFFCVVCKKRFKYDTSCRRHQKNVHQMELRNNIGRDESV